MQMFADLVRKQIGKLAMIIFARCAAVTLLGTFLAVSLGNHVA